MKKTLRKAGIILLLIVLVIPVISALWPKQIFTGYTLVGEDIVIQFDTSPKADWCMYPEKDGNLIDASKGSFTFKSEDGLPHSRIVCGWNTVLGWLIKSEEIQKLDLSG